MSQRRETRAGPAVLAWDPAERLAVLRFVEEGTGGRPEAQQLVADLDGWVEEADAAPFRFLVDCSAIIDVDAGWRATWAEYFRQRRTSATVAWFNANARIRLVILMFRKGTGIAGKAFDSEDDARRWLDGARS